MIYFEWDDDKNRMNLRDHGIAFDEVTAVFDDPYRLTLEDSVVDGEQRWRTVGLLQGIMVVLVIHLEEDFENDVYVRIISARRATPFEAMPYEQNRASDGGSTPQPGIH